MAALVILIVLIVLIMGVPLIIMNFQNSYYRQKLKNRGVDTSHVDNITLIEILFKD